MNSDSQSVSRQLLYLISVSFAEILTAFALLFVLGIGFAAVAANSDSGGVVDRTLGQAVSSVRENNRYQAAVEYINTNQTIGTATVFALWAVIGLVLCNVFFFLRYSEAGLLETVRALRRGGKDATKVLEEQAVRLSIRIFGIAGVIFILIGITRYVLPTLIGAFDIPPATPWMDLLVLLASTWMLVCVTGHMLVVCVRCIALKKRLLP